MAAGYPYKEAFQQAFDNLQKIPLRYLLKPRMRSMNACGRRFQEKRKTVSMPACSSPIAKP
jgi:hypothetical protein